MKVVVTGATGFVGRALCQRLARDHDVWACTRNKQAAAAKLGADPTLVSIGDDDEMLRALEGADAVINLAGEGIFDKRWSAARKAVLVSSRVALTERLVALIGKTTERPKVLVSASAVGFYGDRGEESLDERSSAGDDFLSTLCQDWEKAAARASDLGLRVVHPRIGIVLGSDGGALARMIIPFRFGAGGRLGSGRQWMSWIHLDDLVELFVTVIEDTRYEGAINATAPEPATNRDFTKALANAVGLPAIFPAPGFALRIALGEAASVLLGGQKVLPNRAAELGFAFRFPEAEGALVDLVRPREVALDRVDGKHRLSLSSLLDAPLDEVFEFFSKAENLGAMTPSWMGFRITQHPGSMAEGIHISYRIQMGPLPMTWVSVIEAWDPKRRFVDVQVKGPYKSWWHEHRFTAQGSQTLMEDTVRFEVGYGPLAGIAFRFFVGPTLRRIFSYRQRVVERRFQGSETTPERSVA